MAVLYAIISSIIATVVAVIAAVSGTAWLWVFGLYTGTSFATFTLLIVIGMVVSPARDWDEEVESEIEMLKDHLDSRLSSLIQQLFHRVS